MINNQFKIGKLYRCIQDMDWFIKPNNIQLLDLGIYYWPIRKIPLEDIVLFLGIETIECVDYTTSTKTFQEIYAFYCKGKMLYKPIQSDMLAAYPKLYDYTNHLIEIKEI